MSYWDEGIGRSKGYSRAVETAYNAVHAARNELTATLKREYPKDAQVRVTHYRGAFLGAVVGWDPDGARVLVKNNKTGKMQKWWAAHVELTPAQNWHTKEVHDG